MARNLKFILRALKRTGRCRGCGSNIGPGEKVIEIPCETNRPVTFICDNCVVDMDELIFQEDSDG